MRSGRVKPGESEASPVQFSALYYNLLVINSAFFIPLGFQLSVPSRQLEKNRDAQVAHLAEMGRSMLRPYKGQRRCLAGCGCQLGLARASFVDDGSADEVAPFGPGAVVVADLVEAEQILQNEPGVRAALADAAVGDDFVLAGDAFGLVEIFQVVVGLEGTVFVGSLRPRDIRGLGNVAGALSGFGHARRSDDFARELIDGANVDKLTKLSSIEDGKDFFLASAEGFVCARNVIGRRDDVYGILGELALLLEPLLAATVDEADVLVAVKLQLPEGVGGEPVVVVAVEKDAGAVGNAGSAEKFFESGLVNQITADVVLKLGLPIPSDGAGDVSLVVGGGVHVDFDEAEIGRIKILRGPIG